MPKRFTSTEIWDEDWFQEMEAQYKLFWFHMLAKCDFAGVYKVNVKSFNRSNKFDVDPECAFIYFNEGKDRIRKLNPTLWLIEDFFVFQYGHKFNINNKVHQHIDSQLKKAGVGVGSLRGLAEVVLTPKEKEKDKENNTLSNSNLSDSLTTHQENFEKNDTRKNVQFRSAKSQGQDIFVNNFRKSIAAKNNHTGS